MQGGCLWVVPGDESWSASAIGLQSASSSGQSSRMWAIVSGDALQKRQVASLVGPKCASVGSAEL